MSFQTPRGADKGRVVLRGDTGYWLTGAVALIFLLFLISAALQGGLGFTVRALPWALFILWALYLILIRPCVILVPGTVEVVNVLRRYVIDWHAIESMTTKYQLVLALRGGRRITSWGASAPMPRRSQVTAFERIARTRPRPAAPKPHVIVKGTMLGWENPRDPAARALMATWDWAAIIPLVVLAALCALEVVISALVR